MLKRLVDPKEMVFGIGLPRTGTRSLTKAMALLGYNTGHYFDRAQFVGSILRRGPLIDFACDLPIPLYIDELAAAFPRARFIFTERALHTWAPSISELLERNGWMDASDWSHWRYQMFGRDETLPHLLRVYKEYQAKAAKLAQTRDVLFMDIEAGDGFDVLCKWLGRDLPTMTGGDGVVSRIVFPHEGARSVQAAD